MGNISTKPQTPVTQEGYDYVKMPDGKWALKKIRDKPADFDGIKWKWMSFKRIIKDASGKNVVEDRGYVWVGLPVNPDYSSSTSSPDGGIIQPNWKSTNIAGRLPENLYVSRFGVVLENIPGVEMFPVEAEPPKPTTPPSLCKRWTRAFHILRNVNGGSNFGAVQDFSKPLFIRQQPDAPIEIQTEKYNTPAPPDFVVKTTWVQVEDEQAKKILVWSKLSNNTYGYKSTCASPEVPPTLTAYEPYEPLSHNSYAPQGATEVTSDGAIISSSSTTKTVTSNDDTTNNNEIVTGTYSNNTTVNTTDGKPIANVTSGNSTTVNLNNTTYKMGSTNNSDSGYINPDNVDSFVEQINNPISQPLAEVPVQGVAAVSASTDDPFKKDNSNQVVFYVVVAIFILVVLFLLYKWFQRKQQLSKF